jgi:hypothetical protein
MTRASLAKGEIKYAGNPAPSRPSADIAEEAKCEAVDFLLWSGFLSESMDREGTLTDLNLGRLKQAQYHARHAWEIIESMFPKAT